MKDARCLACGYDLSGAVATWEESCPLRGMCSECGGEVEWSEVLGPARGARRWHVEATSAGRTYLGRAWQTWARGLLPWRYWREAGEIRAAGGWWRLALWFPAMVVPLYALKSGLGNAARGVMHALSGNTIWNYLAWASDDWTMPFALVYYTTPAVGGIVAGWTSWTLLEWPAMLWGLIVATAAAPAVLALWPREPGADDARWLSRASVLGTGWVAWFGLLGVTDGTARLLRTATDWSIGMAPSSADERWLVPMLMQEPGWWLWMPMAWWAAWWWHATRAGRLREQRAAWLTLVGVLLVSSALWHAGMNNGRAVAGLGGWIGGARPSSGPRFIVR